MHLCNDQIRFCAYWESVLLGVDPLIGCFIDHICVEFGSQVKVIARWASHITMVSIVFDRALIKQRIPCFHHVSAIQSTLNNSWDRIFLLFCAWQIDDWFETWILKHNSDLIHEKSSSWTPRESNNARIVPNRDSANQAVFLSSVRFLLTGQAPGPDLCTIPSSMI